ncbi:MAG: DUF1761 domain-containing protein [Phycisphaerales bacterium]|nr:DUF1761 domain-containing protein [Phycisphaerales bacterium]
MLTVPWGQIHWPAVAVAAVATFFLGAVWYMALFGKLWQRLHGFSDEKVKEMQKARPPHIFFGVMIFSYALMSLGVAVVLAWCGVATGLQGAGVGLVLWLGIAAAIGLTAWIASDKPFGVYAIDLSYQLVFLIMTGFILGAWR